MSRKKPHPDQLSLDLGGGSEPTPLKRAQFPTVTRVRQKVVESGKSENVATAELMPPLQDHEIASRRETTAFELYQRAVRETRTLILTAAFFAVSLLAVKSGATNVEKFSWFGMDLTINDRTKISGVLGVVTLLVSLWSVASAYTTNALWNKCGLFYREIIEPSGNRWLVLLYKSTRVLAGVLIFLLIVYSVISATTDMFYLVVARPSDWIVEVIRNK
ncbi:MAG: hypothetical protein AB7U75_00320 [Hyphomicrobiaceae bacterium]